MRGRGAPTVRRVAAEEVGGGAGGSAPGGAAHHCGLAEALVDVAHDGVDRVAHRLAAAGLEQCAGAVVCDHDVVVGDDAR